MPKDTEQTQPLAPDLSVSQILLSPPQQSKALLTASSPPLVQQLPPSGPKTLLKGMVGLRLYISGHPLPAGPQTLYQHELQRQTCPSTCLRCSGSRNMEALFADGFQGMRCERGCLVERSVRQLESKKEPCQHSPCSRCQWNENDTTIIVEIVG